MGMFQVKAERGFVQPIVFRIGSFLEPLQERDLPQVQDLMHMQMGTNGYFVRKSITDGVFDAAIRLEVVSEKGRLRKMWLVVDNFLDVRYAHLEEISAAKGNVKAPWPDALWMDPAKILVEACERYVHENAQRLLSKIGTPYMIEELQDFLGGLPWADYLFHTEQSHYVRMSDEEDETLELLATGELPLELVEEVDGDDNDEPAEANAYAEPECISAITWTLASGSQIHLTDKGASLEYKPVKFMDMYLRRKELSKFNHEVVTVSCH